MIAEAGFFSLRTYFLFFIKVSFSQTLGDWGLPEELEEDDAEFIELA